MKNSIFLVIFLLLINCEKKAEPAESYYKGSLTVLADDSFQSVMEALAEGYMINYPDSDIKVENKKEDIALLDLLQKKAKIIVMSRDLSESERKEYERVIDLPYEPAKFAADAVLFVVPKESTINSISYDDIQKELLSDDKKFVFDGTNSSNLNFVAQTFKKKPSELKFSVIDGNANVVEQLSKYPNKIGVISLNTFSRPYSKEAEALRAKVKVLSIQKNGKMYTADAPNLRTMSYPFTRVLYFLKSDGAFTMANGFIRYSCTQLGQIIVEKEGLQKYNLYERQVQMH